MTKKSDVVSFNSPQSLIGSRAAQVMDSAEVRYSAAESPQANAESAVRRCGEKMNSSSLMKWKRNICLGKIDNPYNTYNCFDGIIGLRNCLSFSFRSI